MQGQNLNCSLLFHAGKWLYLPTGILTLLLFPERNLLFPCALETGQTHSHLHNRRSCFHFWWCWIRRTSHTAVWLKGRGKEEFHFPYASSIPGHSHSAYGNSPEASVSHPTAPMDHRRVVQPVCPTSRTKCKNNAKESGQLRLGKPKSK